jgi:hypothetical protein
MITNAVIALDALAIKVILAEPPSLFHLQISKLLNQISSNQNGTSVTLPN